MIQGDSTEYEILEQACKTLGALLAKKAPIRAPEPVINTALVISF